MLGGTRVETSRTWFVKSGKKKCRSKTKLESQVTMEISSTKRMEAALKCKCTRYSSKPFHRDQLCTDRGAVLC
jgi:hypothetical protein